MLAVAVQGNSEATSVTGFRLTAKQLEANELLAGPYRHVMLEGGSRSAKTFTLGRAVTIRAMRAPRSRHGIFRYRFNSCKTKVFMDTMPKVFELCFPQVPYVFDKTDFYIKLPNGSEIWCGGLDDKQRVEKVLGGEHATLFFNECSEIPRASVTMALTRLAQAAKCADGTMLPLRAYYDQNPAKRSHWTYRLFHQKRDPETKEALLDASLYASLRMNPKDNEENLAPGYIDQVLGGMSARMQRRFLRGEYADETAGSLFVEEHLDRWRNINDTLPEWQRIVIAVDPSGADDEENEHNDAIGIVVAALGVDGNGYLLEDLTIKAGPATWGNVATSAYDRHRADRIVAEANYGGAMVRHVIETARPRTPFTLVNATRGKVVRAEPIGALVEKGKVRLAGYFPELEEELAGFTTQGYTGEGSPNRADAFVWAFTALFPGIVAERREPQKTQPQRIQLYDNGTSPQSGAWMV